VDKISNRIDELEEGRESGFAEGIKSAESQIKSRWRTSGFRIDLSANRV